MYLMFGKSRFAVEDKVEVESPIFIWRTEITVKRA